MPLQFGRKWRKWQMMEYRALNSQKSKPKPGKLYDETSAQLKSDSQHIYGQSAGIWRYKKQELNCYVVVGALCVYVQYTPVTRISRQRHRFIINGNNIKLRILCIPIKCKTAKSTQNDKKPRLQDNKSATSNITSKGFFCCMHFVYVRGALCGFRALSMRNIEMKW